jgi:hypothetical protein
LERRRRGAYTESLAWPEIGDGEGADAADCAFLTRYHGDQHRYLDRAFASEEILNIVLDIMLDENLPAFFYRNSPDGIAHHNGIFFSIRGSDPSPAYSLRHGDPATSRNCYAAGLFDCYNPEVLYGEVLIKPEWSHPSLSQEEIRRNGGVPPPPMPILPTQFTVQLYNPDLQVTDAETRELGRQRVV